MLAPQFARGLSTIAQARAVPATVAKVCFPEIE